MPLQYTGKKHDVRITEEPRRVYVVVVNDRQELGFPTRAEAVVYAESREVGESYLQATEKAMRVTREDA